MAENQNSGGFFNQSTGVAGDSTATFFGSTSDTAHIAILNNAGTVTLSPGVSASSVRNLIGGGVSTVTDNSDGTFTVTNVATGASFVIDTADNITFPDSSGTTRTLSSITVNSDGELVLSDAAGNTRVFESGGIGGRIWLSRETYDAGDLVTENGRLFISQFSNNTNNNPLTDSTNWMEFEGGSPAPHARLRVNLALSQSSIQLPILGTRPITGTVTSEIVDSQTGDVINDTIITSVHSSYADDRISGPVVVSDTESRFIWSATTADNQARTITFTVSGSVNYVIGTQRMTHAFNETINLTLVAAPVLFWTGAITQADLDTLSTTTNLADNIIAGIPRLTQRENFSSPYTLEYNGGAAGATPSLYAAIIVDQSILITSLRAEGISVTIESHNDSTAGRTLYVSQALLSEGPHNLTWRT